MSTVNQLGKYQPYPEYKNSGINHIGLIPKDWCTSRIGFVTQCLDSKREPLNAEQRGEIQGEYPYWGANGIVDYISKWLFNEPLVLIGEDGAPFFDLNKDVAFNVFGKLWVNNHAHIIRPWPHKVDGVFLKYALNVVDFHLYINGSTRDKLTQEALNSIVFRYPSQEEQRTIAAFLDYETARIDQLIAKQQQLIELLKEKRQAVISHAVTKGLNPNAPMKDSGVEWLGQVPEHWEVVKLSYVLSLKSGDGITSNEIEPEGTYPVYGGNGLRGYCEQFNCNGSYALIGRQGALCGNVNVADGKFFASEHAVVVYPRVQFDVRFLSEFLIFMDLGQYSVSAAQPGISVERINMLSIAVPPIEDQSLIGQRISQVELQIERLVVKAEAGVLLLKERRTALISAAVTGKIDLRGWQPPKREVAA